MVALGLLTPLGCLQRKEPPGAGAPRASAVITSRSDSDLDRPAASQPRPAGSIEPGSIADSLPFVPDGTKIASIAWRTWIYTDVGPRRRRYGYLRAGTVVDARGPAIRNEGCPGGWYRINPRGFVCLGKGATLDLDHPVVRAMSVAPERGRGLPYIYVMAAEEPPFLYYRLPTKSQMKQLEGDELERRSADWRAREQARGALELLGPLGGPPEFLAAGQALEKPYGVKQNPRHAVHAGRAAPDSGFAVMRAFEWEGRVFGLTTELDLIPLDRTRIVRPSTFRGVELGENEDLPVAMVENRVVSELVLQGTRRVPSATTYRHRDWIKLTGNRCPDLPAWLETRSGGCVPDQGLRIIRPRDSFPSFATGGRKWLDVSLRAQSLVAYLGRRPVYVTLVSTGRGGLGDPETTFATPQGTFMIHDKHVAATMDGTEDRADSYALLDVPFVQYFHKGYALHGTYWHDEYGQVRSHGCINLAPVDAAWLFEWTDPPVFPGWHHVINPDRGTVVYVHP